MKLKRLVLACLACGHVWKTHFTEWTTVTENWDHAKVIVNASAGNNTLECPICDGSDLRLVSLKDIAIPPDKIPTEPAPFNLLDDQ